MRRLNKHFYIFAALQLIVIFVGAVVGLFMAPVSGFVSTTEAEAWHGIIFGLLGITAGVLGILLLLLSIIAGIGIGRESRWGRIFGKVTAIIALVEFPLGTAFGIYALKSLASKHR